MLGAENIILGKVDLVPTLKELTFWRKKKTIPKQQTNHYKA